MWKSSILYHHVELHYHDGIFLDLPHGWSDTKRAGINSQLWLVVGGGAYLRIGDREYRVGPGDFCLLPETVPVAYGCDREKHFQVFVVQFVTSFLSDSLFNWVESPAVVKLSLSYEKQCTQLFKDLFGQIKQELSLAQYFTRNGRLHTLLSIYFELAGVQEKKREDWMSDTLQYIDSHLDTPLSVQVLADRVHLHPNYFIQRFHTQIGLSPAKFIAEVRMRYACKLLEKGEHPVTVAEKIGIEDSAQFSRAFKRYFSMTPRQYQMGLQNKTY